MKAKVTTMSAEQTRKVRNMIATNVVSARRYLAQKPMIDVDRRIVASRISELRGMQETLLVLGTTELNSTFYRVTSWLERKLMHSY